MDNWEYRAEEIPTQSVGGVNIYLSAASNRRCYEIVAAQVFSDTPCGCDCLYCRNFARALAANKADIFPPELDEIFTTLGIDVRFPAEVGHVYDEANGRHLYTGWYTFLGALTREEKAARAEASGPKLIGDACQYSIKRASGPMHPVFAEWSSILAVEFLVTVPWVLDETPDL